ncbi:MAG: nucleotide exchange factor GrpE [Chitinivibrionales bacterium]|nr:nucleotide exchange factor GrpE [Chitinivibrionales bacterium]
MKKKKTNDEEVRDMNQEDSDSRTSGEQLADELAEEAQVHSDDTGENVAEEAAAPLEDSVELLKEKLKTQKDNYVRLIAEFDNFKRRTAKEYERIIANANERLMLEIIEVRENFERALNAEESGGDLEKFLEGMKLIYSKLDEILSKNGLEPFAQVGDRFDPNLHDALMKRQDEAVPEDHIAEIYEKGYQLKGKVIKHAKVIVSEGAVQNGNEQATESRSDNEPNGLDEKEQTVEE